MDALRSPRRVAALLLVLALLTSVRCAYPAVFSFSSQPKQNVLLILSDDMRFDSLWAMPTLSELAQRGVVFNRFFISTPLCCPSRATFLTGQYARNHGVVGNSPPFGGVQGFDDRSTLATWLHDAGVRTGLVGRYLNGYASTDIAPGWDFWFSIWQASEDFSNYYDYRATDNCERRYFGSRPENYSTRVIAQQALRFLEQDREKPFMLMLTPRTPHGPATPDPVDSGIYKDLDLQLPPSYNEADVSDKPTPVRRLPLLDRESQKQIETFRRRQYEALAGLDRAIGVVLEALRTDGRLERTWIIYSSDNGLTLGEHRRVAHKSCPYEECVRVPLVVIPPGGASNPRTDDHLVANIDIAPTVAEILGGRPSTAVDGRSLVALVNDQAAEWRDSLVLEMLKEDSEEQSDRFDAIRTTDRKFVRYPNGEEELYDESADPFELENLAAEPGRAAEKAQLADQLDTLINAALANPDRRAPREGR